MHSYLEQTIVHGCTGGSGAAYDVQQIFAVCRRRIAAPCDVLVRTDEHQRPLIQGAYRTVVEFEDLQRQTHLGCCSMDGRALRGGVQFEQAKTGTEVIE